MRLGVAILACVVRMLCEWEGVGSGYGVCCTGSKLEVESKVNGTRFYIFRTSVVVGFSGFDPLKDIYRFPRRLSAIHRCTCAIRSPAAQQRFFEAQFSDSTLSPVGINEMHNRCSPKKQSNDPADDAGNAGHVPRPKCLRGVV